MNCHYLMYKTLRSETPYEAYIKKKKEEEEIKERQKFYADVLKFRQSRYPRELMQQLEREINPFELSLQKLKQVYNSKFPQYSNELVHEAVEFVFKRKCKESEMVKESALVIEYGDEDIRNGRKLMKEDFTYDYSRVGYELESREGSINKSMRDPRKLDTSRRESPFHTDRQPIQNQKNNRSDSPSKLYEVMLAKTEKFNEMLMKEIKRQRNKFQNIQVVEEGSKYDIVNDNPLSYRSKEASFPHFLPSDLVRAPQGFDTGRSELQQLNHLLSGIALKGEEESDFGMGTGRSRGSSYTVKINKEVMDNLYNARGKLKIDLVRRVVDRMRKQGK